MERAKPLNACAELEQDTVLHLAATLPAGDHATFILSGAAPEPVRQSEFPRRELYRETSCDRALDIVIASLVILFVLPLMVACSLLVLVSSPGPLLFRQSRIGRGGREFTCLKFRTMVCDADRVIEQILQADGAAQSQWSSVQKIHCDPRVTSVGRLLRRYCLDELPQLFNVLAGDMSVVGPRPIVTSEIVRYGESFGDYCSVKPGLTGLWQVSGRHSLPYDERVRLDCEYARSKSVAVDLLILWRTVPIVMFGLNE
jgi:exopolysaccharide production protein ExoY